MPDALTTPPLYEHCILFATADWDDPYWTNKQHCAKSLAEMGVMVLYVESVGLRSPKAGSSRDWKRLWNRLGKGMHSFFRGAIERAPGIYVLSPLVIPAAHRRPLLTWINRYLLRWAIKRSTFGRGFKAPLIWTYHPFMLDEIEGMKNSGLLYHCVDDLAAVPGVDAQAFRAAEAQLIKRADIVFVTATTLLDMCRNHNQETHYLPNVVDAEHFGRAFQDAPLPADLVEIPEPRLVYHGVLSDFKIDFELLLACAHRRPAWQWVLIGEEREGQRSDLVAELAALPNVHCLGYRAYKILPDYLRGMQVGLLPTRLNDYTRGMFPMKYFEYLAAGLPVVSTRLPFTESILQGLAVGDDPDAFARAIEAQLKSGRLTVQQSREYVGENTWQCRTRKMLETVIARRKNLQ